MSNSFPSPVKWLTDQQYAAASQSEKALAWADSQVGVKESGANRGKPVQEYQAVAGLGSEGGFAWCACFVYWCLIKAQTREKNLPAKGKCAAVQNWSSWSKFRLRTVTKPQRGRLFYWLNTNGTGHIGWCLGPSILGIFRTIEGNTDNDAGSREGDGVYKRTRHLSFLKAKHEYGFIDLKELN